MSGVPEESSQSKLDSMFNFVGQKLGRDPQELRQQIENGQLDQITQKLDPQQKQQIESIMSDPGAINRILQNPQVKRMIEQLTKGR
jgi:methyl coenzyme M reductase subunit C-like uncharacterized protein (methanogenesis marker protein 7)